MKDNYHYLKRAHRRYAARHNTFRCDGTTSKGTRCLSTGTFRREDGTLWCRWHRDQKQTFEARQDGA